jgi:outer membrane protein TolC
VRESNCLRTTVVSLNSNAPGSSLADIAPIHGLLLRLDVNLNQELFSFGRLEAAIASAQAGLRTARGNLEREQADLAYRAHKAYFGLKAARAAVDTINDGLTRLQKWIDDVDAQLSGKNQARYSESDLARLKVAREVGRLQLLDQQRNLDYAAEALRFLTSDPDAVVDDGELTLSDPADLDELAGWLARAQRSRPEVHLLHAGEASVHAARWARLADLLPDLSFTSYLGFGYATSIDTPQNYFFNRPNFLNATLGLQLLQPLDLGVRAARYQQARHEEQATRARSRQAIGDYSTEIAKALADWQEAKERAKASAHGERIARGWYHAVDESANAGLQRDGRELVEVLQHYFTFRLRSFQALYDANVALAWLRRTAGELGPRPLE